MHHVFVLSRFSEPAFGFFFCSLSGVGHRRHGVFVVWRAPQAIVGKLSEQHFEVSRSYRGLAFALVLLGVVVVVVIVAARSFRFPASV